MLVVRLTADRPGALTFAATLDDRRDIAADMYRYDAELGAKVDSVTTPPRPTWASLGGGRFAWRGRGHPDGTHFDARFEVRNAGGTLTATADGFRVADAQAVTILLTVGTDFRGTNPGARAGQDLNVIHGRDAGGTQNMGGTPMPRRTRPAHRIESRTGLPPDGSR